MSEWLGKPKLKLEDISRYQPSLVKYFPRTMEYFAQVQQPRVVLSFPPELFQKLKQLILTKHGRFGPELLRRELLRMIQDWISSHGG